MADDPANVEVMGEGGAKKGLPKKKIGIIAAVAVLQAVAFFVVFKLAQSGPEPAHGEDSHVIEGDPTSQPVGNAEVMLLKSFKVPNDSSGVTRIYDIDLSVVVTKDGKEDLKEIADQRAAEIADRVAYIVRAAPHKTLTEPDLRVLKTQLLEELREITRNQELIRRVLIPKFVPIRAE